MSGYSGMVALDVSDLARARALATGTRVFQLAESLGGVQSLISVPALQTHASVPKEMREAMGVTEAWYGFRSHRGGRRSNPRPGPGAGLKRGRPAAAS